jgi:hypothetical protein
MEPWVVPNLSSWTSLLQEDQSEIHTILCTQGISLHQEKEKTEFQVIRASDGGRIWASSFIVTAAIL